MYASVANLAQAISAQTGALFGRTFSGTLDRESSTLRSFRKALSPPSSRCCFERCTPPPGYASAFRALFVLCGIFPGFCFCFAFALCLCTQLLRASVQPNTTRLRRLPSEFSWQMTDKASNNHNLPQRRKPTPTEETRQPPFHTAAVPTASSPTSAGQQPHGVQERKLLRTRTCTRKMHQPSQQVNSKTGNAHTMRSPSNSRNGQHQPQRAIYTCPCGTTLQPNA